VDGVARTMTYLVEVPIEAGGRLLVQASEEDLPHGLELAARSPGEILTRAAQPLGQALDELRPAVETVRRRLSDLAPDEVTVEFGIVLGAETGVVVAKGTTEVHFTVTLTWKPGEGGHVDGRTSSVPGAVPSASPTGASPTGASPTGA
jgi:hypothetical protein